MIEDYKVAAFFTAPTGLRAVRKEDPQAKLVKSYDVTSLRTLFLAGERADPDTVAWAQKVLGVPIVDHWWQTETGWPIAANPVGLGMLPIKLGSPSVPMPGYDVHVVDEATKPVPAGTMGSLVIKLPLPPGCLPTLYRQDERMRESYLNEFPGYYKTADAGLIDDDGISPSSGGRTTSSTLRDTACRPVEWRRSSPHTRTLRNAPCLASRTRSKARRRAGLWS